jgi:hypothetical protein
VKQLAHQSEGERHQRPDSDWLEGEGGNRTGNECYQEEHRHAR